MTVLTYRIQYFFPVDILSLYWGHNNRRFMSREHFLIPNFAPRFRKGTRPLAINQKYDDKK